MNENDTKNEEWTEPVRQSLVDYYKQYYWAELKLKDWEQRIGTRLSEERIFARRIIDRFERWFNWNPENKRVLVVGAGTGAEVFEFIRRKADVWAVEPNANGLAVMRQKAALKGYDCAQHFTKGTAENLPFEADHFDLVYCYTVLEHVADITKSIDEMLRVCKRGSFVFIETPNYRFPWEGHYKLALIPFAPKWLQRLFLKLRGRYTPFFESINFVTERQINRILWARDVVTTRISEPLLYQWSRSGWQYWFTRLFGIQRNQYIVVQKHWE